MKVNYVFYWNFDGKMLYVSYFFLLLPIIETNWIKIMKIFTHFLVIGTVAALGVHSVDGAPRLVKKIPDASFGQPAAVASRTMLRTKAANTTESATSIYGPYIWEYLTDGWSMEPEHGEVTFSAGDGENGVVIKGLWEDYEVKGTFDPATGYLTIPAQEIDPANGIWFKRIYDDPVHDKFIIMEGPYQAYLSGEDFLYEDEHIFGIVDADDNVLLPAIDSVFFKTIDMSPAQWNVLSSPAKFSDGWVAPALDMAAEPYDVTVWQNKSCPTLYALVDPYGPATPFADINLDNEGKGFIVIDVTNPDCVLVKPRFYSGLEMPVEFEIGDDEYEEFDTQFYIWNMEQCLATLLDRSADEIINQLGEEGLSVSTYSNGVITIHNCIFGDQDDPLESYTMSETAVSVITLPDDAGVDATISDADQAPVYYNLQGIRVDNPSKNTLYIRRASTGVEKVILK